MSRPHPLCGSVLRAIIDTGPLQPVDVAAATGLSLPDVHRVLLALHAAGQIDHDADGAWFFWEPALTAPRETPDPMPSLLALRADVLAATEHAAAIAAYLAYRAAERATALSPAQRTVLSQGRGELAKHTGELLIAERRAA